MKLSLPSNPPTSGHRSLGWSLIIGALLVVHTIAAPTGQASARTLQNGPDAQAERLADLQAQIAIAEAEQRLAEARRKTLNAEMPTSDVTPLDGKTTIDESVKVEAEMMTYEAASHIAAGIVATLTEVDVEPDNVGDLKQRGAKLEPLVKNGELVILHDDASFAALKLLETFYGQASILKEALDPRGQRVTPHSAGLVLDATRAFAGSALDLLSLFRQDTEYKGRAVTLKQSAIAAQIAGRLAEKHIRVVDPRVLILRPVVPHDISSNEVGAELAELRGLLVTRLAAIPDIDNEISALKASVTSAETEVAIAERLVTEARARIDRTKDAKDLLLLENALEVKLASLGLKRRTLAEASIALAKGLPGREANKAGLLSLKAAYDAYVAALVKVDEKTGMSPLGVLINASHLNKLMWTVPAMGVEDMASPAQGVFVLRAEAATAGGSYRIRRNLFTTVFTGDLLSYSGGAAVSYSLHRPTGDVVSANVLRFMTGFSKFKKLPNVPDGANFKSASSSGPER